MKHMRSVIHLNLATERFKCDSARNYISFTDSVHFVQYFAYCRRQALTPSFGSNYLVKLSIKRVAD